MCSGRTSLPLVDFIDGPVDGWMTVGDRELDDGCVAGSKLDDSRVGGNVRDLPKARDLSVDRGSLILVGVLERSRS